MRERSFVSYSEELKGIEDETCISIHLGAKSNDAFSAQTLELHATYTVLCESSPGQRPPADGTPQQGFPLVISELSIGAGQGDQTCRGGHTLLRRCVLPSGVS